MGQRAVYEVVTTDTLGMDNVVVTLYVAWYSKRSARVAGEKAAKEIVGCLERVLTKIIGKYPQVKAKVHLREGD